MYSKSASLTLKHIRIMCTISLSLYVFFRSISNLESYRIAKILYTDTKSNAILLFIKRIGYKTFLDFFSKWLCLNFGCTRYILYTNYAVLQPFLEVLLEFANINTLRNVQLLCNGFYLQDFWLLVVIWSHNLFI